MPPLAPMAENTQRGRAPPPGIPCLRRIQGGGDLGFFAYRRSVLIITFVVYASYHVSRKPLSIVKSVLAPEIPSPGAGIAGSPSPSAGPPPPLAGWSPFDGKLGKARLGEMDVAYLAAYAVGMYFAGHLADRMDLRIFLTAGMISSGTFVCLFGAGFFLDIHSFAFFFLMQVGAGLLSTTGWPAVVAIMANWYGEAKNRGAIMGAWNAHTSVGNIVGSFISAAALHYGWGWSFLIPGVAIISTSALVFAFLAVDPASVGLPSEHEIRALMEAGQDEESVNEQETLLSDPRDLTTPVVGSEKVSISDKAMEESSHFNGDLQHQRGDAAVEDVPIGFFEAWNIPGVALYALCLFFVKLVAYTFLFWLPFYIKHTEIGGAHISDKMAGILSTLFDVGGVVGGILAGLLSDRYNSSAVVSSSFVFCAIPSLYLFHVYGGVSLTHLITLMMLSGLFVNGPYSLITTAVSADLGTHSSLKGNAKALATVTAIIDGTGSVGAAIGPFLTGYISVRSWSAVFWMLSLSSFLAGLLLLKLAISELREKKAGWLPLEKAPAAIELQSVPAPEADQT